MKKNPVLVIVIAQLFGTSLWFSANSASEDLMRIWAIGVYEIGLLTNCVQLGFIFGTLSLSLSGVADRYLASRIFTIFALAGAIFNAFFALFSKDLASAYFYRFFVGIALAGIYPLGMKMIVGWNPDKAAQSLGILIGMLTIGTALPHGLRMLELSPSWQGVVLCSSGLAIVSSFLIYKLGDGPYASHHQKRTSLRSDSPVSNELNFYEILQVFRIPAFKASALGYFGHMWELYSFWTLTPTLIYLSLGSMPNNKISGLAFLVISVGAIGCVVGGFLSKRWGSEKVAFNSLAISALMCLIFPFNALLPAPARLAILLTWGIFVIADSPQFSAMSAKSSPPYLLGRALTLQNCIGYCITMASITWTMSKVEIMGPWISWLLLPGPILGLIGMRFSRPTAEQ